MSVFRDLPLGKQKKTEPAWHPAIKRSFLFVPTAGMRVAPEVLVLELYREVFFAPRSQEQSAREINPTARVDVDGNDRPAFDETEQAVLYATRGRRKRNVQSRIDSYYTPAYPGLARHSWLRRKSDRVIKDFLFRALSQKIHGFGKGSDKKLDCAKRSIYAALRGTNISENSEHSQLDIMGLGINALKGCMSEDESLDVLSQHLGATSKDGDDSSYASVFKTVGQDDRLASRIYEDFVALCGLEATLDRLQWLELLKCFLRLSTSIWMLAHMQLTILARDAMLDALGGSGKQRNADWPSIEIRDRGEGLLQPSITPTQQVLNHVDNYMRARVELNLLTAVTEKYCGDDLQGETITALSTGSGKLPLADLVLKARKAANAVAKDHDGSDLRAVLTRECERYKAWVAPRKQGNGQGKNYDEFLRVLRRMTKGDEDGGYLLTPQGDGFVVFPGHLMLKLVSFLSGKRVKNSSLVLADVEEHFSEYGIDFGNAAGARPRLISTMQEIGMLRGSPDAGDSVEISRPYK